MPSTDQPISGSAHRHIGTSAFGQTNANELKRRVFDHNIHSEALKVYNHLRSSSKSANYNRFRLYNGPFKLLSISVTIQVIIGCSTQRSRPLTPPVDLNSERFYQFCHPHSAVLKYLPSYKVNGPYHQCH